MTEAQKRQLAAGIIRTIGAGVSGTAAAFNPGIGIAVGAGVELVARITETAGLSAAEPTLRRLAENPVPLITQADLDGQTADVIAELMGSRPTPVPEPS